MRPAGWANGGSPIPKEAHSEGLELERAGGQRAGHGTAAGPDCAVSSLSNNRATPKDRGKVV
jgi:hypothetical protein